MAKVDSEIEKALTCMSPWLEFHGSKLCDSLKEIESDNEDVLKKLADLKGSDCFTKFAVALEDYSERLKGLAEEQCAPVGSNCLIIRMN